MVKRLQREQVRLSSFTLPSQLLVTELKTNALIINSFEDMSSDHHQALKQLQSWDDTVLDIQSDLINTR